MITRKEKYMKLTKYQMINACWTPIGVYKKTMNECKYFYDYMKSKKNIFNTFLSIIDYWNMGYSLNHGINIHLSTMFVPEDSWFKKK